MSRIQTGEEGSESEEISNKSPILAKTPPPPKQPAPSHNGMPWVYPRDCLVIKYNNLYNL